MLLFAFSDLLRLFSFLLQSSALFSSNLLCNRLPHLHFFSFIPLDRSRKGFLYSRTGFCVDGFTAHESICTFIDFGTRVVDAPLEALFKIEKIYIRSKNRLRQVTFRK